VHLRNGDHGYGGVTKVLHWLTVAALAAQFLVGWSMDFDEGTDREDELLDAEADRLEDEDEAEGQGEAAEEQAEAEIERREEALDAREDVAAQILFLAAIAAHVGLVLKHTVVRRNLHLARML
jgi:cytochrome b561